MSFLIVLLVLEPILANRPSRFESILPFPWLSVQFHYFEMLLLLLVLQIQSMFMKPTFTSSYMA